MRDPARARATQVDRDDRATRERLRFFNGAYADGKISIDPLEAERLIQEYNASGLEKILEVYELEVSQITHLALTLNRAPISRSSTNTQITRQMLIDCSKAKDPEATMHLLASVNRYQIERQASPGSFTHALSISDVKAAREHLEHLVYKENRTDAMVLLGQFLERERMTKPALMLYHKAMDAISNMTAFTYDASTEHPLPLMAPWTALGNLLLTKELDLEGAKKVFTIGAMKADDPLAYYYLAQLEEPNSVEWLEYTTKAAMSGHLDAAYDLGNFYMLPKQEADKSWGWKLRRQIGWLDDYEYGLSETEKPGDARKIFAMEWYSIAGRGGHKPSLLAIAIYYKDMGFLTLAASQLVQLLKKPPPGEPEKYPEAYSEAESLRRMWVKEREFAEVFDRLMSKKPVS